MLTRIAGVDEQKDDAFRVTTLAGRYHPCGLAQWSIPLSTAPPAPALVTPAPAPAPPVTPKLPDPRLSGQTCFKASDFANKQDTDGYSQAAYSRKFCQDWEGQKMTSSSPALKRNPVNPSFGTGPAWKPYHYTVTWIAGCQTSAIEQSVHTPLGDQHALGANCELLMHEDYLHCKSQERLSNIRVNLTNVRDIGSNGGVGGYRDAECLRYSFSRTTDAEAA